MWSILCLWWYCSALIMLACWGWKGGSWFEGMFWLNWAEGGWLEDVWNGLAAWDWAVEVGGWFWKMFWNEAWFCWRDGWFGACWKWFPLFEVFSGGLTPVFKGFRAEFVEDWGWKLANGEDPVLLEPRAAPNGVAPDPEFEFSLFLTRQGITRSLSEPLSFFENKFIRCLALNGSEEEEGWKDPGGKIPDC